MMIRKIAVASLALGLFGLQSDGQSAADLLQKGIYLQETVGDLDGAIKIYHQVIASAAKSRSYAAQAQYRLALCLQRRGQSEEARNAFRELIDRYPEQKDLVAKAREFALNRIKLLPIPWEDGELAAYHVRLPGGTTMGRYIRSVEISTADPQRLVVKTRYVGEATGLDHSEVRADSMEPLTARTRNFYVTSRTEFHGHQALLQTEGEPPRTIEVDVPVFTDDELPLLLRRLPLVPGYKTTVSILNQLGIPRKYEASVLGVEPVKVPAGVFNCYKLELQTDGFKQLIWVETDQRRELVQFDMNGIKVELVEVGKIDRVNPVHYRDAATGLAVTAPPGWVLQPLDDPPAGGSLVAVLDLEGTADIVIEAKEEHVNPSEIEQRVQEEMKEKARQRAGAVKDYHLRSEGLHKQRIGENDCLSFVADYVRGERKMVEYRVGMRSTNAAAQFAAFVGASDFDKFREGFDQVLASVKLK